MGKDWSELSVVGQRRRLYEMARLALNEYPIEAKRIELLGHGENATFRVSTERSVRVGAYQEGVFLLRLHGRPPSFTPMIESEMAWLNALRKDEGLSVPEPVLDKGGRVLNSVCVEGYERPVTVMKWLNGQFTNTLNARKALALGQLLGRLHRHARSWKRPAGFQRGSWGAEGLFGENAGFEVSVEEVWSLIPEEYREVVQESADAARSVFAEMGTGADVWGLIHADLHEGNVLFAGNEARPIDFDDCREGLWLYDLAVAMNEYNSEVGMYEWLGTVLDGYDSVHKFDRSQLEYMPKLMAGRQACLMLWVTSKAQVQPAFQELLPRWAPYVCHRAGQWLRDEPPLL